MTASEPSSIADELAGQLSPGTVIKRDEPMARHTTLRVGGPADVYVEPATEADLAAILQFCGARGVNSFCWVAARTWSCGTKVFAAW